MKIEYVNYAENFGVQAASDDLWPHISISTISYWTKKKDDLNIPGKKNKPGGGHPWVFSLKSQFALYQKIMENHALGDFVDVDWLRRSPSDSCNENGGEVFQAISSESPPALLSSA
jgi:hypothetical protein